MIKKISSIKQELCFGEWVLLTSKSGRPIGIFQYSDDLIRSDMFNHGVGEFYKIDIELVCEHVLNEV